jgi:GNAT superfamily N-acetyltransferase
MNGIRRAELSDLEDVVRLLESFPEDIELPDIDWQDARRAFPELIEGERGLIFLSEKDGELAALLALSFSYVLRFGGEYALIEDLIVDKHYRGRGLASPLLQAGFEEARRRGCREIQVNGASEEGLPVYMKNGMHLAGKHLKLSL